MTDYTKENDWVHDMVIACGQNPNSTDINGVALYHIIDLIRQDERASCAKLLDDFAKTEMVPVKDTWRMGVMAAANAVRGEPNPAFKNYMGDNWAGIV